MTKRKRQVRSFSIIASILLIFSLFTPGTIGAEANDSTKESLVNSKTATSKVSSRLVDEFEESEKVTFLVKLKDKADTDKAVEEAQEKAESNQLSAKKSEFLQRSSVISELKTHATESQQRLDSYLTKAAEDGNAENVHSYYIVNAMAVTATKEVAQKISAFDEVEKILPNEEREIISPVETEGEPVDDDDIEWNVDRVNAPQAWDMGYDGTGTVIASIDTGVQWDHPALKEKYRGYDSESDEVDHSFSWYDATAGESEPYDDQGHGTHTIGTMVGGESDGSNQVGVAPGAKFISVKAFTEAGGSDADLLDAAEWIMAPTDEDGNERADLAPDVVNNSWGGGPGLDEWYRDVVKEWRNAEIFPEFSAGNVDLFNPGGPESIAAPANYPESFATGATDKDDDLADFSLQGPSPYDEVKPDISAPGVSIRSAMPGDEYGLNDGTSMAGPAVSGVAALLRQVNSNISVEAMEEVLTSTATPLTDDEFPDSPNNGYGAGLVDAQNAISSLEDGLGTLEGNVSGEGSEDGDAEEDSVKLGVMGVDDNANQLQPVKDGKDSVGVNDDVTEGEPLDATVTVVDTDRSVNTDPEDGSYSLTHPAGDFTVMAEAYGHISEEQDVSIEDDETTEANFALEEEANGVVQGTITNESTGDAVEDATVLLEEDANVDPVTTDEDGHYELTAYEGEYTMKVMAKDFHSATVDVTVTEEGVEADVELEPFYTYPGDEIAYDDGTADNARAFYDAGNGWAVKMSLPEGKDTALVTDGVFKFWGEEFPEPGGTEFQVEVWDSSGEDGLPGEKIAGPIDAEAVRDETDWTVVDLEDESIIVDDDFYMVYIQTAVNTEAPGLATDETSPNAERSYQYVSGDWEASPADEGNYMIRARVDYEVEEPVIESPEDGDITNEEEVTVEGTASPTTSIELQNNGEEVDTVEVDDDGNFSVPATLEEGANELVAVSQVDGDNAGESEAVEVTLDTESPELTIDSPADGDKTNRETVTVEGTVADDNLDTVTVNGEEADVSDGDYSKRILLDNGENTIDVVATDKAGNEATESITIDVQYDAPEAENLTPDEDVDLSTGESVKIEFDSEPGLKPTFFIHMPLTNNEKQIANATELPMMEESEGHYVGYWTVPQGVEADGGVVEVKVTDDYGNETRQEADGKLFINQ
ncbi:MAG TPA: S8 family serine peptidase [Virgibacillus sp.]|nr:S8 family serine peptidase [Virgibacillus sp.]